MLRIAGFVILASGLASGAVLRTPFSAVGKCPEKDPANPVYLPDTENCQIYYECSNGEAVKNHCAGDLQWNSVLDTCDFPENVKCEKGNSKKSKAAHPLSAVGECPAKDPANPIYLPDSENCQVYYECSNGEAVKNHCAGDLQWNSVLDTCDFPENVKCEKGNSKKSKPKAVHPLSAVGECPEKDPANPIYLPDSENCQIYYECSNGEAVKNHCADDLQWNSALDTCDFPENVKCEKGNSKKSKAAHPLSAVGECPAKDPANPVYLPDSENCQIYYECSNGEAVKNHCAGDLQWNPTLNTCDFPQNVNCEKGKSRKSKAVHPLSAVGECPAKDPANPVYLPDSENCQVYYECSNGEAVKNHCSGDLQWNSVLDTCDFPQNVHCEKGKSKKSKAAHPLSAVGECPEKDPANPIYLPDSENCQIYYECSNGEAVKNYCAGDLQWNSALDTCDFPENVKCEKGNSKKSKVKAVQPLSAVGECPEKDPANPIYLPDSENCQIYYECSNGEAVKNHCANDLQWNPTLDTCDFPQNVNCKKGNSKKPKKIHPYKPVGTCPVPQGSLPVYLPDSDDCAIFYECDAAGEPQQKECQPGLAFNPTTHVCEYPETAGCKAGSRRLKLVPLMKFNL